MSTRFLVGMSLAAVLASVIFATSATAGTAFRATCVARGDNDLFLLDPQTFSLPEENDAFQAYINLCVSVDGHPRVDGDFFR